MNLFIEDLRKVISHCCSKGEIEFTVSDFETANLTQDELDNLFDY